MPEDKAIIAAAKRAIDALNQKYGGGFYLFTRERTLDEGRGKYSGFERKRGALLELAKLMCGDKSELNTRCGDAQLLRSARYILTLDGDTVPSPGSVRELIGANAASDELAGARPRARTCHRRARHHTSAHVRNAALDRFDRFCTHFLRRRRT